MALDFKALVDEAQTSAKQLVSEANEAAQKVINADNAYKLVQEVRENSEDPRIVAFQEWKDKADAEILRREQEIDALIVAEGMVDTTPVDVAAETAKYSELVTQLKGLFNLAKNIPGAEDALSAEHVGTVTSIPGARGAKQGQGAGVPRPRLSTITLDGADVFLNTVKDKGTDKETTVRNVNLTVLAQKLGKDHKVKVEPRDLQHAMFEAAGTTDITTLGGKPISFYFEVSDSEGNAHNHAIVATPKS